MVVLLLHSNKHDFICFLSIVFTKSSKMLWKFVCCYHGFDISFLLAELHHKYWGLSIFYIILLTFFSYYSIWGAWLGKTLELYKEMLDHSIQPDVIIFNTFMFAGKIARKSVGTNLTFQSQILILDCVVFY
jgi:hypothetical protein